VRYFAAKAAFLEVFLEWGFASLQKSSISPAFRPYLQWREPKKICVRKTLHASKSPLTNFEILLL
jgi:hypothetical protein